MFLVVLYTATREQALHSAIDTDWTGAVNTSSVASSFLDLVQAARPN